VALSSAGHCVEADQLAQKLIPRVREAGYEPLLAQTLVSTWKLADQCVEPAIALARMREGYTAAIGARDDDSAAQAAVHLAALYSDRAGDNVLGREWLSVGTATLRRFENHPLLDAWRLNIEGILLLNEGHGAEAAATISRSRIEKEKILGPDHLDVALMFNNLGNALVVAARGAEAVDAFSESLARIERAVGGDHPSIAFASNNLGEALNSLHRHVEARAAFTRAVDLWRRAGTDPQFVAYALTGQGIAILGEGKPADAAAPLEEALRTRVDKKADHEHLGETRFALARALWARPATHERARALAREARADYGEVKTAASTVAAIDAWLAAPAARL